MESHQPPRPNVNVLLEQVSPNDNVLATVEEQRGVVYLYLHAGEGTDFDARACWVRNLRPAPAEIEVEAMKRGEPPLMPAKACAHPDGAPPLDPARLSFLWFEEGDGVALYEGDDLLAVVPGWSGHENFRGYARDCAEKTPLAWPLKDAEAIPPRLAAAQAFWQSWEKGNAWAPLRDAMLKAYDRAFGREHGKYYAIDGGKWPPRALARYETDRATVLVTLGVCIRPQPKVEQFVQDPRPLRRIELGMALDRGEFAEPEVMQAANFIGAQANLPWHAYSWLGNGHTVGCDPCPVGDEFDAMLLLKSPSGAPPVLLPPYRDDPVNLLWMVPVTESERRLAAEKGSGELMAKLAPQFPLWPHRKRTAVA
jgi:hypothetical protein